MRKSFEAFCNMKNSFRRLAFLTALASGFFYSLPAYSQGSLECRFISEPRPDGKKNEATCSADPEDVFSSIYHTPQRWKHCQNRKVYEIRNIENMIVNFSANLVSWDTVFYLPEFAADNLIEYQKNNNKKVQSKEELMKKSKLSDLFYIKNVIEFDSKLFIDELDRVVPGGFNTKNLQVTFGNENEHFVLLVNIRNNKATLQSVFNNLESQWVKLKFGVCVIKQ